MTNRYLTFAGFFVFSLLAFISLAATLIPFLPSKEWYVRIFDYPRLQTFFIAVLAVAWYLVFFYKRGRWGYSFIAMFLVVIIIQGYKAWPYTPLAKKQVLNSEGDAKDSSFISLFICNVLQTNNEYNRVIEKVNTYNPDIVITTESDSIWQEALKPLEKRYPFLIAVPQSNTYGMHVYSKLPLKETQVRYLVQNDIPSIHTMVKLANGAWIDLFVVHPRPPVPGETSDSHERDGEIIMVGKEARQKKGGVIVAGDFNDVAWSETTELFQEVTGFLDPRRGRGFYNTFHAQIPIFRWPLDHIFHSAHFKLGKIKRVGKVNSDHFPMYIKLSYEPSEIADQPAVKPEPDTEEKANEAIENRKKD